MDLRQWSHDDISEFIDMYKSLPCLWRIKSNVYKNKNLKEQAYKALVKWCNERGFSEANKDFVQKKIQNLRGSFRKELKRIENSRRSGNGTED